MTVPADDLTRRLVCMIVLARGELLIATNELEEQIGLVGDIRHSRTLLGTLEKARVYFEERGFDLTWRFYRREIAVRYAFSQVTRNTSTGASPKRRIMAVT